jgi:hypothetical protein
MSYSSGFTARITAFLTPILYNRWNTSFKTDDDWNETYSSAMARIRAESKHYDFWKQIQMYTWCLLFMVFLFGTITLTGAIFSNVVISGLVILSFLVCSIGYVMYLSEFIIVVVYKILYPDRDSSLLAFNSPIQNANRSNLSFDAPKYNFIIFNKKLLLITTSIFLIVLAVAMIIQPPNLQGVGQRVIMEIAPR